MKKSNTKTIALLLALTMLVFTIPAASHFAETVPLSEAAESVTSELSLEGAEIVSQRIEGYVDNSNDNIRVMLEDIKKSKASGRSPSALSTEDQPKADIVFLIDTTGSMGPYIQRVKDSIAEFVTYLGESVDMRIGIIEYQDITYDGIDSTKVWKHNYSTWHYNSEDAIETLTKLVTGDGGDIAETPLDAFGYLFVAQEVQWRSDAYKFAFLLTDANYKINNRHGYTSLEEVVQDLEENNIYTSVVTRSGYDSYYGSLWLRTGGIWADIDSPSYSQALKDFADSIIGVTLQAKKAIYVLPTYLGAELYSAASPTPGLLWPDVQSDPVLGWVQNEHEQLVNTNANGSGEVAHAYGKDIVAGGLDDFGSQDIYTYLVNRLKTEFDAENGGDYDVKFFPYNWLGDINQAVDLLDADSSRYDKISIVTHGTGGLVASAYVSRSRENRLKVEKLVLIAPSLFGTYASLFPLERGDTTKSLSLTDFSSNNNWFRRVAKNSPTMYQSLPNYEYFDTTRALDLRTAKTLFTETWTNNANWSELYATLNNSVNINADLLSGSGNPRSHKNFREQVLLGEDASVIDNLRMVDTTVIGTRYGHSTPKTAQYDIEGGYSNAKLIDIKYDMAGDGTVFSTSLGLTLDSSYAVLSSLLDAITYSGTGAPNHTELVRHSNVIDNVVSLINAAAGTSGGGTGGGGTGGGGTGGGTGGGGTGGGTGGGGIIVMAAGESGSVSALADEDGMEPYVKLRVESAKDIIIRIYDFEDKLVAESSSALTTGFDGSTFICDQFGDGGETLTSIYMPKAGYKVRFYHGTAPDVEVQLVVGVHMLTEEGDYLTSGIYVVDKTLAGGELLTLDMIGGVTTSNFYLLASATDYPSLLIVDQEIYLVDWSINLTGLTLDDGVVVLNNVGDTAVIGITGEIPREKIQWHSSDPSVVSVTGGTVTAVSHGTAVISASAADGSFVVRTARVKVFLAPLTVRFEDMYIFLGERQVIKPEFNSSSVTEVDVVYTFDSDIIEIEDGVVLGVKLGEVVVTGTAFGGISSTFKVGVYDGVDVPVSSVTIAPDKAEIGIGEEFTFTATISPSNATNNAIIWNIDTISPFAIVEANNTTCKVIGVSAGVGNLAVVSQDGGFVSIAEITVAEAKLNIPIFRGADGGILTALTSDELNVSMLYENEGAAPVSLTMFVAVYTRDGRLVHTGLDSLTVAPSATVSFEVELSMPENVDGLYAKNGYTATVFLWDTNSYAPVLEEYVFP